jgi:hypothetical protein
MDLLINEAVQTRPKENFHPETLSAFRFPDRVENKIREEKRQEAAIAQYYKIEEAENQKWMMIDDEEELYLDDDGEENVAAEWLLACDDEEWLSLDGVNVRLRQTPIQIVNDMICRYKEIVDMINRILSHRIRGLKSS